MILSKRTTLLALALLTIWAAVVLISGAGVNVFSLDWDFENTGQFGDSFGSLSALMASIAALSAIATFREQQRELERLRQKDVADEIRIARSQFERTFFQLLDSLRAIVSQIDIIGTGSTKVAHDAFKAIWEVFLRDRQRLASDQIAWQRTAERYANDLNHYFRFLYHLITYVDRSSVDDKYFYVKLVRASLSDAELVLIALNCGYGEGRPKFKPLVERYSLLHNMSEAQRSMLDLSSVFEPQAFQRSSTQRSG